MGMVGEGAHACSPGRKAASEAEKLKVLHTVPVSLCVL